MEKEEESFKNLKLKGLLKMQDSGGSIVMGWREINSKKWFRRAIEAVSIVVSALIIKLAGFFYLVKM